MKIIFLCIGKTSLSFLKEGENDYFNRLKHYVKIERIELEDIKNAKTSSVEELKKKEGDLFLRKIDPADELILLDERGKSYSSIEFAHFIQHREQTNRKLIFLVGGAYGVSPQLYARANATISLSKMTFSHQMIRMIFLEQLYRAYTILANQAYHHA